MSDFFYLPRTSRVIDYSAAVKGASSIITVKIKVTDTYALGEILRDLGRAKTGKSKGGDDEPAV